MKKNLLLGCFFMMAHSLMAQKENNVWCFGIRGGIDFNSGKPVAFSGCAMHQLEGSASIADANGNLLFYTDGDTAWNKNNQVMPHGTNLLGNPSTTQAALIVNSLSNKNQYYVFTAEGFYGEYGGHGFNYSIVDMTLDGGLGDVDTTRKNKHLLDTVDERIVVTPTADKTGLWIVVTGHYGQEMKSFKLTAAGLDTIPVVTATGVAYGDNYSACLKFSPDGSKLAMALHSTGSFDIFDFDRATGKVSNHIALTDPTAYSTAYGVEFSPNGKYLYATTEVSAYLYQFDLTATDIAGSVVRLFNSPSKMGTLQLAPDGKIYMAHYFSRELGVIENPDEPGLNCNYNDTGFTILAGEWCQFGLPNMFVFEPVFASAVKDVDVYTTASVFPNPAKNTCTIKTAVALKNEAYTLFDITGRTVQQGTLNGTETQIAVNGLSGGIYLLKAGSKLSHVFKLVKE